MHNAITTRYLQMMCSRGLNKLAIVSMPPPLIAYYANNPGSKYYKCDMHEA